MVLMSIPVKIQVTPDEYQQLMEAAGRFDRMRGCANSFLLDMQWAEEVTRILALSSAQSQMMANASTEVVVNYAPFDKESSRFLPRPNPSDPAWMLWRLLEGETPDAITVSVRFLGSDELQRLSAVLSQFSQIVAQIQSEGADRD